MWPGSLAYVYLLVSMAICASAATTTTPPLPTATLPTATDKLEESLIMSLLKIVDEKFETLSSRMGQMERAVTGLQFFTMRTLRGLSNKVQTTASLTQAMHGKLGDNAIDARSLTTTVGRISHDLGSLKESNSKMFEKLDRSIAFINRNIDEKSSDIMSSVESIELRREEEGVLGKGEEILNEGDEQEFTERRETVLNCTVDLRVLQEELDRKFNHLRNQSHFQYEHLRNQSEVHYNKLKFTTLQEFERLSKDTQSYYQKQSHLTEKEFNRLRNQTKTQYNSLNTKLSNLTCSKEASQNINKTTRNVDKTSHNVDNDVLIDNEHLFRALSNMTSHVVQSISFIRHTESMLERIIENTDTVVFEQEKLRKDVVEAVSQHPGVSDTAAVSEGGTNISQEGSGGKPQSGGEKTGCTLPEGVLKDIATFSKNGSQLFEILTDLAQMSQVSLSSSIVELQDELGRMEETRVRQEEKTKLLPSYAPGDYNLALQKILNTSKNALRMAEAIAPNTGWIPYIYHHIQHVEKQLNRSMTVTTRFLKEVRGLKGQLTRHDANAQTQGTSFNVPNDPERRNATHKMSDEALELILETNSKLKRIMPALTRFIAEPEPLISLMDGRKTNEGRVEIFQHGQWGTICDGRFGHVEAAAICRHLGFIGGIFAGRGQFGPGTGVTWSFNHTCLHNMQCPVVGELAEDKSCSHRGDVGVICDHMLRLVAFDGNNDVDTGIIEIYQNSKWRPVCAHGFGRNEAQVSCRQMGYRTGWMRDARSRSRDNTSVWMTNVQCRGTEIRLDACRHNNFGQRPCPRKAPAAVTCE